MMVRVEQYCRRCGGFVRLVDTDGSRAPFGEHSNLEDCVDRLVETIGDLESRIVSIESKLEME